MTPLAIILIVFIFIVFFAVIIFVSGGFLNELCQRTKIYIQIENLSKEFDVIINKKTFVVKKGTHYIDFEVGFIILILKNIFNKDLNFVSCKLKWKDTDKVIKIIEKYFGINKENKDELKEVLTKDKFDFDKFIQKIIFITKNKLKIKNFIVHPSKYTIWGLLFTNPSNLLNLNKEVFVINIE